ncbi:MAG: carboxypeptidase-like regulatory domain-containing protein, partial [Candidatus Cloacimonetes bacterium]|nr:carboxypeptidase-like regulatory domain-containing protein [Candidatus Cloacimonadota bacterium]
INLLDEDSSILEMIEIETLLASEEEITCQIALILPPSDELQTTFIQTEIIVDFDDDPANNISNPLNLYILPFGQISQRIGTGTFLTTWYPMNFNFHNSLSETIYYPSEMVYTGEITAVSYFNHFMSNLYNKQTRLWIGTTSQNNLANGWVPAGNLTEVFNGYLDYPFGNNQILIPLDSGYYYAGGNLAVMCNRPWDMETYSMDDEFYGTTNSPYFDRTRAVNSNTSQINPDSPPEGYLFSRFPNTVFHIEVDNIGSVGGYVKNTGQQLLNKAVITVQETQRRRITNSEGYFLFGNLLDETYQFKASCLGYEDQIIVQTVIPDQVMEIEFLLEELPLMEIYGQLRGSDQLVPGVEGADIRLTGYDNGFTISEENGFFQLSNVYAGRDYELIITHPSYQQENVQIELGYNDMDLGEIVISERVFPPDMVWADLDADENTLELSWHVPPAAPADSRELVGYDIYRFLFENNVNPNNWIQLAINYPDTVFVDQEWASLPFDDYQYAVLSIYTAEVKSDPAYSNVPSYLVAVENPHLKPAVISLGQSYPNPFLLSGGSRDFYTRLNFSLIDNAQVELSIYNLKGEKIITLLNQDIPSGDHSVFWDGMDNRGKPVNSGIYFYRFVSDNSTLNRKLVILK